MSFNTQHSGGMPLFPDVRRAWQKCQFLALLSRLWRWSARSPQIVYPGTLHNTLLSQELLIGSDVGIDRHQTCYRNR